MKEKVKFEEAMTRLQEIVEQLESGEATLEDSMKLFEEGAKLSAQCYKVLEKAEQRITELANIGEAEEEGHDVE